MINSCFCFQTAREFQKEVEQRIGGSNPLSVTGYVEAPLAYDAVWALALALNKTQARYVEVKRKCTFPYTQTHEGCTHTHTHTHTHKRLLEANGIWNVTFCFYTFYVY